MHLSGLQIKHGLGAGVTLFSKWPPCHIQGVTVENEDGAGIDLHPRARTQLSAGFSSWIIFLWDPESVFSLRIFLLFPVFWPQTQGLVPLSLCWAQLLLFLFIYILLFPESLFELSLLSLAAPGNSGRQSARPLHQGFLFLIKLTEASPEGLVEIVKVKDKTLELLFPGERGCVSSWNLGKGQGWDQGLQVPLDPGGAGSQ